MLIEDLHRVGRLLLDGGIRPVETLKLLIDAGDEKVKNFYRNVFVVWVGPSGVEALPRQVFGEDFENDFRVSADQARGAPVAIPTGGNPIHPQGRYGLPVYPVYDPHLAAMRESVEGARSFVQGRLARTVDFPAEVGVIEAIAIALHERVKATDFGGAKKSLGVLVLARTGEGQLYRLAESNPGKGHLGQLGDGRYVTPDLARILPSIWRAKLEEGAEAGRKDAGVCSLTGAAGPVVSAYCKSWPWAFTTWTCPLPRGGDESMLIEGVALSEEAYKALTLGACVFNAAKRDLDRLVVSRELFSPVETRAGKDEAQRKNLSNLPAISGSAYALPLEDATLGHTGDAGDYTRGVLGALSAPKDDPTRAARQLQTIAGFDLVAPEGLTDRFRLTLVYFSGDYSRGDVQLRAFIQDVLPSVAAGVRDAAKSCAKNGVRTLAQVCRGMSEKQAAYLAACYGSVPYLLARGYGGSYLWQLLEGVLHRRPLPGARAVANAARRLESLVPKWPASRFGVGEEVAFLLHLLGFIRTLDRDLNGLTESGDAMKMRPWKELIRAVEHGPIEGLALDSPAEVGFACGLVVRRFGAAYSRELGKDKDYLKHRVLTFGSDLAPRDVERAVQSICGTAIKHAKLHLFVQHGQLGYVADEAERKSRTSDFQRRLGVVLCALDTQREAIAGAKDEFMVGFWAGHSLQGYDRPVKLTQNKGQDSENPVKESV